VPVEGAAEIEAILRVGAAHGAASTRSDLPGWEASSGFTMHGTAMMFLTPEGHYDQADATSPATVRPPGMVESRGGCNRRAEAGMVPRRAG